MHGLGEMITGRGALWSLSRGVCFVNVCGSVFFQPEEMRCSWNGEYQVRWTGWLVRWER